jgi:hypothetical protein
VEDFTRFTPNFFAGVFSVSRSSHSTFLPLAWLVKIAHRGISQRSDLFYYDAQAVGLAISSGRVAIISE